MSDQPDATLEWVLRSCAALLCLSAFILPPSSLSLHPSSFSLHPSSLSLSSAFAHELPRERTILLELSPESIEAMVVYQEPPGRAVEFLVGRFDFDGDGELKGAEAKAAGSEWAPRALQGLTFVADGKEFEADEPRVKFDRHHNGALSSAVYLSWEIPDLKPRSTRTVHIRRDEQAAGFTTLVRFQIRPGLTVHEAPGDSNGRRLGPFELRPGDDVPVTVRRVEKKPPELPTARP